MYDLVQVASGNSAIAASPDRDAEQAWGAVQYLRRKYAGMLGGRP